MISEFLAHVRVDICFIRVFYLHLAEQSIYTMITQRALIAYPVEIVRR